MVEDPRLARSTDRRTRRAPSAAGFTAWFGGLGAGLLGLALTLIVAATTYLAPGTKAEAHRAAGNAYLALKEEARRLRTLQLQRDDADEVALIQRIEILGKRKTDLDTASAPTPEWAVEKARRNIEELGRTQNRVDRQTTSDN